MIKYAALGLAALTAAGPASAQIISVSPQTAARHFGYFVGDIVIGTSVVTVGPGVTLDANALPAPGPAATAIDIRSVGTSMSGDISAAHRYTITVSYQDFVSPDRAVKVEIPGYDVGFLQGSRHLTAQVAGFGFTASPFRDDIQPVLDPSVLQPDHAGSLADDAGAGWLFAAGAALAAVAATGLLIERLPLPGFRRRLPPFAAAARQIARQRKASPAAALEAVLRLHEAFDATVGRRVFADDLDDFLAAHRHFLPLRADVEQFFHASRLAFFGQGNGQDAPTTAALHALSRDLMRAEQRR